MKIFVTGGAGYIGSHTCVELIQSGHDVIVADSFVNSHPKAIDRVKQITGKSFPFYKADIRDKDSLNEIFTNHAIDCVIHFAGLKAVGESVQKPVEYYHNNLLSTINLCDAMRTHNVKKLVFSSSATVYRENNPMPLSEDSALGCSNPYGWTKLMCERILEDTANANAWSVALLRYFNPVGAHESGLIGEDPLDIPNNLMPFIAQTAVGRFKKLCIYGDDYNTIDGTGVRDYIHVADLAKGHVAAAEYCKSHAGTQAINLGTGLSTSVLQLVNAFSRTNGVDIPCETAARRPGDIAIYYADPSKAKRLLGWSAKKSIEDMCADAWRWQTLNPNGYSGE